MEKMFATLSVYEVTHMVNLPQLGERLKALRLENRLTQKQVAERIGLAISAVSSYESSARYPSYDVLISLAHMYHVSTDFLLGISEIRPFDTAGLTEDEIAVVSQLIELLRQKHG